MRVSTADGTVNNRAVYLVSSLCVGRMCAENLRITLEDSDSLLGADFMYAAHVSLALKDGIMTLSAR